MSNAFVLRTRAQAVYAGQINKRDFLIGDLGASSMLLDRHAGKVRDLLPETCQSIEESGFAGVWRAYKRDSVRSRSVAVWSRRNVKSGRGGATVAVTHKTYIVTSSWAAVSRRRATSEPSTRNTRGSPPGAQRAAVTLIPGRKPSSINTVDNTRFALAKIRETAQRFLCRGSRCACVRGNAAVETELHFPFSMILANRGVKLPAERPNDSRLQARTALTRPIDFNSDKGLRMLQFFRCQRSLRRQSTREKRSGACWM
jgi:hypothetical protein